MDQITQTAERISKTIEERGGKPDTNNIQAKLRLLINEFLIPPEDAERQVTNEIMREQQITIQREAEDKKNIAELKANDWATIEGKVVMLAPGGNPAIAQRGIIADESGAVEFVIWVKAQLTPLEENAWYRIESCVADEFREKLSVKLHSGTKVVPVPGMSRVVSQDWHQMAEKISGSSKGSPDLKTIASLTHDEWATIEGKVTKISAGGNPAITQRGIIADATGAIEFVMWSKAELTPLEQGNWYKIESAVADLYKERMSLKLHSGTTITPIEDTGKMVSSAADEMAAALKIGADNTDVVSDIASVKPNDWVTIEGKIVTLQSPPSASIAQKGIIADASGAIDFVIWEKAGAEPLEEHRWYRFESATIDEYRSAPSMKIHSGTKITPIAEDRFLNPVITPLADLTPGVACVRVKMLDNWEVRSEWMLQTGLVGDETSRMKFVLWKNRDGTPDETALEVDKVYTIYYAGVDEYNERYSLNLSGATILEEEGADIEVGSDARSDTVSGAVVQMSAGSGLIKRCRVEGCNRALSRQNFCPIHEMQQDFRYDLRITGVVDDGITAHNVIMQRDAVEKVTGLTLEKAIELAENSPLGPDDVFMQFQERLIGRYVTCNGSDIEGTLLVRDGESVKFMTYDQGEHAMLINRAEGKKGGDLS